MSKVTDSCPETHDFDVTSEGERSERGIAAQASTFPRNSQQGASEGFKNGAKPTRNTTRPDSSSSLLCNDKITLLNTRWEGCDDFWTPRFNLPSADLCGDKPRLRQLQQEQNVLQKMLNSGRQVRILVLSRVGAATASSQFPQDCFPTTFQ